MLVQNYFDAEECSKDYDKDFGSISKAVRVRTKHCKESPFREAYWTEGSAHSSVTAIIFYQEHGTCWWSLRTEKKWAF